MTKKEVTLLISIGVIILVLYCIAGLFCHPSLDDFIYAWKGRKDNFLETVLNERQTWNGRYFSNFIVHFSPLNWGGLAAYKLMPTFLIGFIFFGMWLFFKNLIGKFSSVLAIVCMLITFSIIPDITEGIYWFTGAFTYIPSGVLFLILLSIAFNYWSKLNAVHILVIVVLSVITCGFNEIIPILGIAIFTIVIGITKEKKNYALLLLAVFIGLFYYVISAPGNEIRGNFFQEKHQLFYSLFQSTLYSIRFIGEWIVNPAFIFWGILLVKLNFNSSTVQKLSFLTHPIILILALIVPTYLCCFGPIWSTGLLGQYRTANLAGFLFVPTFTLIVIANSKYLKRKLAFTEKFRYGFVCLIMCLGFWGNQFTLTKELVYGDLADFNRQMYSRYKKIKACNQQDCYLPEITNQSKLLFVYPLVENPDNFYNLSYQLYFKSGKIFLESADSN